MIRGSNSATAARPRTHFIACESRAGVAYAVAAPLRFNMRRNMRVSFDRTKSAIRGAISARNREPLNTP